MGKIVIIISSTVVLGLGLILSVRDWRAWRMEETKNFGFGPGELYTPAELMVEHFANQFVGIKFNYPSGWVPISNNKFQITNPKINLSDILGKQVEDFVSFEANVEGLPQKIVVSVGMNPTNKNLPDLVNERIEENKVSGLPILGEISQINADRASWTVVNFSRDNKIIKEVYTNAGEKTFNATFEYDQVLDKRLVRTYEDFVRNIIII